MWRMPLSKRNLLLGNSKANPRIKGWFLQMIRSPSQVNNLIASQATKLKKCDTK